MLSVLMLVLAMPVKAAPEMADVMRSNGKIYVVVSVLTLIFIGLAFYLFSIDKKVRKLEKEEGS